MAVSPAGRPRDFQPRCVRDFRRAHRLLACVLRRDRQDGNSRDAQTGLSRRRGDRIDLRRRHARHPDSAVDHLHSLRHRHRDLDRAPVPRRRGARPDAHGPVYPVDAVHHLEARIPVACSRFPLQLEGKVPVDPEDRAVPRHHRRRHVRALRRRCDPIRSGGGGRRAVRAAGGGDLPHVGSQGLVGRFCATPRESR